MRLLLVDLDDTLGDRSGAFATWAAEFLQTHGLDEDAMSLVLEFDRQGLEPRPAFFAKLRERFALGVDVERLVAEYAMQYPRVYRAYPGVREALARLGGDGWRIVVVTNGSSWQRDKIRIAGLTSVIDACCISEEVEVRKPDPRILEIAAGMCGLPLEGAWMVGDSVVDMEVAHAARINSVWIHHGRDWPGSSFAPTTTVGSFTEAAERISGL